MTSPDLGAIRSSETFEELVRALVFRLDSTAILYARPGKDGAQDIRSGDNTQVYQIKYHLNGTFALALKDAKEEASKIDTYRQAGHQRSGQWRGVTHWKLVTNLPFNATDERRWLDEVKPMFTAIGLDATFWSKSDLEVRLVKYPDISRAYLLGEERIYLATPEKRESLPSEFPLVLRKTLGAFFGRAEQIDSIRGFMASGKEYLLVHGPGGIGKTRLVLEAGAQIAAGRGWEVLWANAETMAAATTWYEGLVPERPTVLIVDDPPSEDLLARIDAQKRSRARRWKVVVVAQTPNDPVVRFLNQSKIQARVERLEVKPLPKDSARAMCLDLLRAGVLHNRSEGSLEELARRLADGLQNYPVWIALAVALIDSGIEPGRLPMSAAELAKEYIKIMIDNAEDPDRVRTMLRWVALVGTVNQDDRGVLSFLTARTGASDETDMKASLASLIARRALIARGHRNRLIELRPDVLRDYVLLEWLAQDVGSNRREPSGDARGLIQELLTAILASEFTQLTAAILVSLGRAELLLRRAGTAVQLFDPLFAAIESELSAMSATQRVELCEVLVLLGPVRPVETARLVHLLRTTQVVNETVKGLFRSRTVGQIDVLLALGWPLFHAAIGAQTPKQRRAVFSEQCAIASVSSLVVR